MKKYYWIISFALAVVFVCTSVMAEKPAKILFDKPIFGLVTITHEQIMRLHVMNIAPEAQDVALLFLDGKSKVLKRSVETIPPYESASLEFDIEEDYSPPLPDRILLRPEIISSTNAITHTMPANAEIVDKETGKTEIIQHPIPVKWH